MSKPAEAPSVFGRFVLDHADEPQWRELPFCYGGQAEQALERSKGEFSTKSMR